jgi:hypothetical protein
LKQAGLPVMKDFLEQLAEIEVREPPPEFNRQLHQQVNRTLIVQQVFDLFAGAIVYSAKHFLQAAIGWLFMTVTGRFPGRDRR